MLKGKDIIKLESMGILILIVGLFFIFCSLFKPKKSKNLEEPEKIKKTVINTDDARALLQSTQQLRTHWSGAIITHVGYAILINVAIWSYFLKAYIDSLATPSKTQPTYVLLAAAISAILLGAWRLYTHYIDDKIAGLYPDFLLYEGKLSVPSDHSTSGYLSREVPHVNLILLDDNLTLEQKIEGIKSLVKSKRIGHRGHLAFDFFTLGILIILIALSLKIWTPYIHLIPKFVFFTGILIGIGFLLFGMLYYQKNPSKEEIEDILSGFKR